MKENVSIEEASRLTGYSMQAIRCGLQSGLFPFGIAIKKEGNQNYQYLINRFQLYLYLGRDDLIKEWREYHERNAKVTDNLVSDTTAIRG